MPDRSASSTAAQATLIAAPAPPPVSTGFRRYALAVLLLVYTANFLDRQIVSILAEPLKNDLGVSDTQLGLLTGVAFGVIYCGLGLPLARLADRGNRVWIISASLAVWSVFTSLCGLAANFTTLLAARMGVGLGEAGCTPTAHALIADYTPKEKRASALAIFSMGTPLGSLLGLTAGGIIADAFGWRRAFLVAGIPGMVLAVVVFATLKETRGRKTADAAKDEGAPRMSVGDTLRYLRDKPTFWFMAFGAAIRAFTGYGQGPFLASFFLRVHGQQVSQLAAHFGLKPLGMLGLTIGLTAGVCGTIATWLGGAISDRLGARDIRIYATMPAVAALAALPFFWAAMTVKDLPLALLLLTPSTFLGSLWYGPVYASAQSLVPPHMRATSASILLFVVNMTGLGLGALTVGALSDVFNHQVGLGKGEGVRWALLAASSVGFLEAMLFLRARKGFREAIVS